MLFFVYYINVKKLTEELVKVYKLKFNIYNFSIKTIKKVELRKYLIILYGK